MERQPSREPIRIPISALFDLSNDDRDRMLSLEDVGIIDLYAGNVDVSPAIDELALHGHETFEADSLHPTNPNDIRDKYREVS